MKTLEKHCSSFDGVRLIDLWEIMKIRAGNFVALGTLLTTYSQLAEWESKKLQGPLDDGRRDVVRFVANGVVKECEPLGLTTAVRLAKRLLVNIDNVADEGVNCEYVCAQLKEIEKIIRFEMEGQIFLHIAGNVAGFYESEKPLFGDAVFDAFPSAADDIAEAGKCLALERGTACVFHLMRVMEVGLKVLAASLGIQPEKNWGAYLVKLDAEIQTRKRIKAAGWDAEKVFYEESAAHISTVKTAWRNPTMHIEKQYSVESARDAYNSVSAFMRHLASKLKE